MKDKILELQNQFSEDLSKINSTSDAEALEVSYLGKTGKIAIMAKDMRNLEPTEKKEASKLIKVLKENIEDSILLTKQKIKIAEMDNELKNESFDITISSDFDFGSINPLSAVSNKILNYFNKLNFQYVKTDSLHYRENTNDNINLNISSNYSLLSSNSTGLACYPITSNSMTINTCYNFIDEEIVDSHNQFEAIICDKNFSFANLKLVVNKLLKEVFDCDDIQVKYDYSYSELYKSCFVIKVLNGNGNLYEDIGSIGLLGYDYLVDQIPNAFVINLNIDAICMVKFKLNDTKILYNNDIRILRQYN